MATTVEVLGAFTLVITVFNAILIVLLIHLSFRRKQVRKLVTWIWKHAGATSLGAARAHYAQGGMGVSHEDVLRIIQDATVDNDDWDKDRSLYTSDDTTNRRNMGRVLNEMQNKQNVAVQKKHLDRLYKEKNMVQRAQMQCRLRSNGGIYCTPVSTSG